MKLEERHKRPNSWLRDENWRQYVEAARGLRSRKGQDFDWPSWCYLPSGLTSSMFPEIDNTLDRYSDGKDALTASLAAWSVTKGVWEFDPDLASVLSCQQSESIPCQAIYRLPEWCIYIISPGWTIDIQELQGFEICGAFVSLDLFKDAGRLSVILDANIGYKRERRGFWSAMNLSNDTISGCIENQASDLIASGLEKPSPELSAGILLHIDIFRQIIPFVLYLCSSEPDLTRPLPPPPGSGRRVSPRPVRDPVVWPVGMRIGAALRAAAAREPSEPGDQTGRQVRPHVRRAHWHHYWTGKRADDGSIIRNPENLKLNWVHPMLVGGDNVIPTVHPVLGSSQPESTP